MKMNWLIGTIAAGMIGAGLMSGYGVVGDTTETISKSINTSKKVQSQDAGPMVGSTQNHVAELGFHLVYIAEFDPANKAFARIARDGVKKVMFYEPWYRGWDNEMILKRIKDLTDYGLDVEVSLSNFPYEEGKSFEDKYQRLEDKGGIREKKYRKMYSYTNRFPPEDFRAYKDTLIHLLEGLKSMGINDKVSFEIGSEPNSYRYYWGSAESFLEFGKHAFSVLQNYGYKPVCCGFSTGVFMHPNPKAKDMRRILFPWIDNMGMKHSNSLYMWTRKSGKTDLNEFPHKRMKGGQFSAFGHFSSYKGTDYKDEIKDTGASMKNLVSLMKKMYEHKMPVAYFWHMQTWRKKPEVDGYFDKKGNPKPRYQFFTYANQLIKDGYHILENSEKVKVVGKNQILIFAKKPTQVSAEKIKTAIAQYKVKDNQQGLKKNGWILLPR